MAGAALLAGIPGFENGIDVFVGPVHCERAAIGQHEGPRVCQRPRPLRASPPRAWGKIDAGAISTLKSFVLADRHLFALQFAGDAQNSDDDISALRRLNGFGTGPRIIFRPNQLRHQWPGAALPVTNFEVDLLPLLEVNVSGSHLWRFIGTDPAAGQWFAIDLDSREPALQTHAPTV